MSRFTIKQPGIFLQDISMQPASIEGVSTSTAAFFGETQMGPTAPTLVTSWLDYQKLFGSYFCDGKYMPYAVEGFFGNGGQRCFVCRVMNGNYASALAQLESVDDVSIIYSPNAQAVAGLSDLLIAHCERLRNRFAILDSQKGQDPSSISKPCQSAFAALYYPWIYVKESGTSKTCLVPPCGHVAGIYTRVDVEVGVYRAPANQLVKGATDLEFTVTKSQQDILNPQGVNCIRNFSGRGILVWGARTLSSDSELKYVSVRRLMIYLEQSIKKGTAWTVFEPNNEKTWAKVKALVEGFLMQTWKTSALMGTKQQQAYFVQCDKTTMTQNDIDNGRLIMLIGVAAVKPAEFIILRIGQTAAKPC
jgi:uncharacterized protein